MRCLIIAIVGVLLLSGCSGESHNRDSDGATEISLDQDSLSGSGAASKASDDIESAKESGRGDAEPNLTGPQMNAVRSAEQYLAMTGFSRAGLIEQLSSDAGDGYSLSDATVAVDSLSVDWNENAVSSAKQYLSMTGFSCNGLIDQLSSSAGDRYTVEQARYGAQQAGAC